jgi:hypothetical protein
MITERRIQTSVKQAMRAKSKELILSFASKSTYSKLQESILGGELEASIGTAVKAIYPCRSVVIRKSQLLQTGVVTEKGPTLDEIHEEEARTEAELKAKKAAALAEAGSDEEEAVEGEGDLLAAAEAMESISEKSAAPAPAAEEAAEEAPAEEAPAEEAPAEEPAAEDSGESESSLMKLKKDELVEKAKAAGVAISGTKADIVARLLE